MFSKKEIKGLVIIAFLEIILVAAAFLAGAFSAHLIGIDKDPFPLLSEAVSLLGQHGLKAIPAGNAMQYGMIRGMLQVYNDPYTVFLEPPQYTLQSNQLAGKFGGIGVRLELSTDGKYYLVYPVPDSPAAKAGIQDGDRLVAVENLNIQGDTPLDTVQAAVRGPVGGKVVLTIARSPNFTPIQVTIIRQEIALPSVTWNLVAQDVRVGILQINVIAATTPDEITKAIKDLQSRGAAYFILDFRNNGGGLVDSGVSIANLFLNHGPIMEQQYRDQPVKTYQVEQAGPFTEIPLVLLINHNTASAAEIISGALQAQKRALLIGTPTYGKDSIQLVYTLMDGSSLHVTSAHWWVPGLQEGSIEGKGLQPDIVVPDDAAHQTELINTAIQNLIK
ncbi:MAG: S41 family peptidase [Anaerolineaceae bacterium]|nr:S41 family peptidase [Anaerolineaceae bacterium]